MTILLTGFTGNVGPDLARSLAPHRVLALVRDAQQAPRVDGVTLVEGSLENLPTAVQTEVEAIVHCAAAVAFKRPIEELRRTNVDGTAALLEFARHCPRLRRFIHVSTICVYGDISGSAPELPVAGVPNFINAYEQSKWEAEGLVLASHLPAEIVRLAIVAGGENDGAVRRLGALHHALYWLYQGLIPMIPGTRESRVDLISTEFAAEVIAATLRTPEQPGRIIHASSGNAGPSLGELLEYLAAYFSRHHRGWASGAVSIPDIADRQTFRMFQHSVEQSGDILFRRVCEDAESFLPILLHPRTMQTSLAKTVPASDWRVLVERVAGRLIETNWNRKPKETSTYVAA
jgi:nucleoside-diphosphate-sugar epimerase